MTHQGSRRQYTCHAGAGNTFTGVSFEDALGKAVSAAVAQKILGEQRLR